MVLTKEEIYEIIKNYSKSEDFEFSSWENSKSNEQSIGFLSDQNKICIKFKSNGKLHELYVFLKELPQSKYHRKNIIEMGTFQREALLFSDILANFEEYPIPIPKCFLAKADGPIVLEDLSLIGFENRDLYETLDVAHCEKVLDSVSKLHAASFIMEQKSSIKINKKYPSIEIEALMNGNPKHPGNKCARVGITGLRQLAGKYLSHYREDVVKNAFHYMENIFYKLRRSDIHPNVLSHNDLWINNIMFKYNLNGKLEQAFLIDFQLTSYKPPSYDIQFFLHNCTKKEFRDMNYDHLVKYYFKCLSQQLSKSNININDVMSYRQFEEMQKETLPVVLGLTPIYISFILMPHSIINDVTKTDGDFSNYFEKERTTYMLKAMIENEQYKQRTIECLRELFDYFSNSDS